MNPTAVEGIGTPPDSSLDPPQLLLCRTEEYGKEVDTDANSRSTIQPTTVCTVSESESLLPLQSLNQTADRLSTSDPNGDRMMMAPNTPFRSQLQPNNIFLLHHSSQPNSIFLSHYFSCSLPNGVKVSYGVAVPLPPK